MRRSNFALRLQPSLMEEARKAAESVSALRTEEYFQERIRRAGRAETLRILERAGKGNPPIKGDEIPRDWEGAGGKAKSGKKTTPQVSKLKRRRQKRRGR